VVAVFDAAAAFVATIAAVSAEFRAIAAFVATIPPTIGAAVISAPCAVTQVRAERNQVDYVSAVIFDEVIMHVDSPIWGLIVIVNLDREPYHRTDDSQPA
jgi:hypothetical protein